MKRRFFRFYKARIPRKLKKAARYGIESVYTQRLKRRTQPLVMHTSIPRMLSM